MKKHVPKPGIPIQLQPGQGRFPSKVFFFTAFLYCLLVQDLYGQVPTITAFTPANGPVGTVVTITGTNFNTTSASNIVFFGATQAAVTAATSTQLTVTVPAGATYAPISVLNTGTGLLAYSATNFTPTLIPSKGNLFASDFSPKVDFATGLTPRSVAIGDLDGDGKTDLAVANWASSNNTVSVFRNTGSSGTISYAANVDLATGTSPIFVAVGDLDGDGKPDLAVVNQNSFTVSVFRNASSSGTISYEPKVDFATGPDPFSIAIRDLDGDGRADLAVANRGASSNTVSVLRNTGSSGTISYAAKVDFTTGTDPNSVAIGDLDGDGKADLAVTNENGNSVSVFRNTSSSGTISFASKVDFATGTDPISVAIGDLDGDGKADLAAANFTTRTFSVLRNTGSNGTVSFDDKVDFSTGPAASPTSITIGDVDGDGMADVAVTNSGSGASVFRSISVSGTINFEFRVSLGTPSTTPRSVVIGDLDGDGKADVALVNNATNTVSIFRNNSFIPSPPTITSFTPTSGPIGTTVTITGTNFSATPANNTVRFNGTTSVVTASTTTSITTTVPTGATTGKISVMVGVNTATSATDFTVTTVAPPTITSFTPSSGPVGNTVTITGTNFSVTPANNTVRFNGTTATVTASTATSITTSVPSGATTGKISVTVGGNTATSATDFTVTTVALPTITSFTPSSGPVGNTVTITGTNFSVIPANNTVKFNGTTASVTASTATSITTSVPSGATTGKISVTVGGNTATSATDFVITIPGGAVIITTETLSTGVGGTITKDLVPLITTVNDNLDINSIAIITQPPSGAVASVSSGILTVDYTNIAFAGRENISIGACDTEGNCTTQPFEIEIAGNIMAFNAVSPDGKNPVFRLEYIDLFPDTQKNTVYIYNRWGDEVFAATDYDNVTSVFNGFSSNGNKLPTGTYFYKVVFASGRKTMTGYLELRY